MATFFGICNRYPILNAGTSPHVLGGVGSYLYRRSDDYYCAFDNPFSFIRYFDPSAPGGFNGFEFATSESEGEDGLVRAITVSRATNEGNSFTYAWGGASGAIVANDSRVTFSLSTGVSTADFLPAIPTRRFELTQLFVQAIYFTSPPLSISWYFKPPLMLTTRFLFEGETYTVGASIADGRFIHTATYDSDGSGSTMCAADGTVFTTFDQEKAHNKQSFQFDGGAESKTFNDTESVVTFPSMATSGSLSFAGDSEVGGATTGKAYFPSIVRFTAEFIETGRLHVDCSNTISPTASVIGIYVKNGADGTINPGIGGFIDHYEIGGSEVSGPYIPSTVFDIVFLENGATNVGYLTLYAVVDSDTFTADATPITDEVFPTPPGGVPQTTLYYNYRMSIPALLYVSANPVLGNDQMIVRPSGEIKSRLNSQLWQHRGEARYFAGEPSTGDVYARDDENGEWILMANAWTGVSGAQTLGFASLPFKGAISIAKVGSEVQSRYSPDGKTWQAAKVVCPYTNGKWSIASHEASGSDAVSVRNTTGDEHLQTFNRGSNWQEATP